MQIIIVDFTISMIEEVRMYKLIILSLLCAILGAGFYSKVEAYTVTHVKNVPNYGYGNYNNANPYHADLVRIERHLFNRAYLNDDNATRLSRIEKRLFNQTYSNMSISQRMNNALANYRGEDYSSNNYYAQNNTYYPQNTIRNRLINTFVGQPTGFTPSITNSSYINRFGPSYNRGFYGTNGWGYHNSYHPTMTGAGIHILD